MHLTCFHDDPVHLAQWCVLHHLTEGMTIACPSLSSRALGLPLARGDCWRALDRNVALWSRQCAFDLVLCTHPRLSQTASIVDARCHAYDVRTSRGIMQALLTIAPLPIVRQQHTEPPRLIKQAA